MKSVKRLVSIVFIISKGDIESQRGGGLHYIFDELERYSSVEEIKGHILFIINYKNKEPEELEELYDQFVLYDAEIRAKYESKQYIPSLEWPKIKLFEIIFGKKSYKDPPDFESFQKRVLICSRDDLLDSHSPLK